MVTFGTDQHFEWRVMDENGQGFGAVDVCELIQQFEPSSLKSAVLLSKSELCEVDFKPDFVTFEIPDEFVIGYGLDYDDEYRNLPFIGSLDEPPQTCG